MARRWVPNLDEKIGLAESLGRRLFDQPSLVGATDQKAILKSLDYRHFEEQRDGNVSLDRLGKGSPEGPVLKYLAVRADSEASKRKPAKKFDGWAAIQAKNLLSHKNFIIAVEPSPVSGTDPASTDDDLKENVYHSHAYSPDGKDSSTVALYLKHLFERHGRIEVSPNRKQKSSWLRTALLNLSDRCRQLAEKF